MTSEKRCDCPACAEKGELKCVCVPTIPARTQTTPDNTFPPGLGRIAIGERHWVDRLLDVLKIGIGLANLILGFSRH